MSTSTKPCPSHPERGACEPMPGEPWRCVYGEHGIGGGEIPLAEAAFFMEHMRAGLPTDQSERDLVAVEFARSRGREERLAAAAKAGLFLHRHRVLGRAEVDRWHDLTRAAGCGEQVVPPTDDGLALVFTAALA